MSDFWDGAILGVASTVENEYERQNKEAELMRREGRLEDAAKRAEARAEEAKKRAEQRALQNGKKLKRFQDKQTLKTTKKQDAYDITQIEAGTDVETQRALSRKKEETRMKLEDDRIRRKEGLDISRSSSDRTVEYKGMTPAEARSSFTDAVGEALGVTETDFKKTDDASVLDQMALPENKREVRLYHVLNGMPDGSPDEQAGLEDYKQMMRVELGWSIARAERSALGEGARNEPVTSEMAYAKKDEVIANVDAGIEHVSRNLQSLMESRDKVMKHIKQAGGNLEAKHQMLKKEKKLLFAAMGYKIGDPRAVGANRLWKAYSKEIELAYAGE